MRKMLAVAAALIFTATPALAGGRADHHNSADCTCCWCVVC